MFGLPVHGKSDATGPRANASQVARTTAPEFNPTRNDR
jgi:hypothetical protein